MLWSDLADPARRARLVAELSKAGTSIDHLLLDLRDVHDPGMRREVAEAGDDREMLLRLALEWFGDLGNPQPTERSRWIGRDIEDVTIFGLDEVDRQPTFQTPDFGRLHRLDDDLAAAVRYPKGGRPENTITQATLFGLFTRGLERARSTAKPRGPSYTAIAAEHGLTRTWATPIIKWAEKNQQSALEAMRLSETPPRFSTIVRN